MLDVGRLRLLLAISEHGGPAGAARSLGRTAGEVAGQLADWERELGLALADGDRLTPAGRRLAEHAGSLLGQLESAESDAAAVAGRVAGTLRLGVGAAAGRVLLADALPALRSSALALHVRQLDDEQVGALAADLDVVVVGSFATAVPHPADPAVERRELMTEPLLLAVPAGHRAGGASVRLAELAQESWIGGTGDALLALERAAAGAGFAPRLVASVGEDALALTLVAAGLGVALVPASAAPQPVDGVRFLTVLDGGLRRTVVAAVRRSSAADPGVRRVLDALAAAARRVAAAVPGVSAAAVPAAAAPPPATRRPDPLFDPLPPAGSNGRASRPDPWANGTNGSHGTNGTNGSYGRNGTPSFGDLPAGSTDLPRRNGSPDPAYGSRPESALPPPADPSGSRSSDPLADPRSSDRLGGRSADPLGGPRSSGPLGGPRSSEPLGGGPRSTDPRGVAMPPAEPTGPGAGPRSADPRSADPRSGDPRSSDSRSGDARSGDPHGVDPRFGDPRGGDLRPADPRAAGLPPVEPTGPRSGDPLSGGLPPVGAPGSASGPRPGDPLSGGLPPVGASGSRSGDPLGGGLPQAGPRSGDPLSGGLPPEANGFRAADPRGGALPPPAGPGATRFGSRPGADPLDGPRPGSELPTGTPFGSRGGALPPPAAPEPSGPVAEPERPAAGPDRTRAFGAPDPLGSALSPADPRGAESFGRRGDRPGAELPGSDRPAGLEPGPRGSDLPGRVPGASGGADLPGSRGAEPFGSRGGDPSRSRGAESSGSRGDASRGAELPGSRGDSSGSRDLSGSRGDSSRGDFPGASGVRGAELFGSEADQAGQRPGGATRSGGPADLPAGALPPPPGGDLPRRGGAALPPPGANGPNELSGLTGLSGFGSRNGSPAPGADRPGPEANGSALPAPGADPRSSGRRRARPDTPGPNPYRADPTEHGVPDPFRAGGPDVGPNPYRSESARRTDRPDNFGADELFGPPGPRSGALPAPGQAARPRSGSDGGQLPRAGLTGADLGGRTGADLGGRTGGDLGGRTGADLGGRGRRAEEPPRRSRAAARGGDGAEGTLPPAPAGSTDNVRLSIFEDLQSEWFVQRDDSAPPAQTWQMAADDGWAAAARLAEPTTAGTTTAGLPRRRPQAMAVPGAVGGSGPGGAEPPRQNTPHRSPQEMRGRLSSYADGVRRGRHAERPPGED